VFEGKCAEDNGGEGQYLPASTNRGTGTHSDVSTSENSTGLLGSGRVHLGFIGKVILRQPLVMQPAKIGREHLPQVSEANRRSGKLMRGG